MAIGKSKIVRGMVSAFDKQVKARGMLSGGDLITQRRPCKIVLLKKQTVKRTPSLAQLQIREKWALIDKIIDEMSAGQYIAWKRYYWYARGRGRTHAKDEAKGQKGHYKRSCKHMGYRAYFIKLVMTDKLAEFLYNYLKARLRIVDITRKECNVYLTYEVVHRDDVELIPEPREYKIERIRW